MRIIGDLISLGVIGGISAFLVGITSKKKNKKNEENEEIMNQNYLNKTKKMIIYDDNDNNDDNIIVDDDVIYNDDNRNKSKYDYSFPNIYRIFKRNIRKVFRLYKNINLFFRNTISPENYKFFDLDSKECRALRPILLIDGNMITLKDYHKKGVPKLSNYEEKFDDVNRLWDQKRWFYDDITEVISYQFMENYNDRSLFVKLFLDNMDLILTKYCKYNNLPRDSIFVAYKGGLSLRIIARENIRNFSKKLENKINEHYRNYFKISDNDFEIVLKIPDHYKTDENGEVVVASEEKRQNWDRIYNEIGIISYVCLLRLCYILNNEKFNHNLFGIKNRSKKFISNLLKKKTKEYNKKIKTEKENDSNYIYSNVKKVDGLVINDTDKYPIDVQAGRYTHFDIKRYPIKMRQNVYSPLDDIDFSQNNADRKSFMILQNKSLMSKLRKDDEIKHNALICTAKSFFSNIDLPAFFKDDFMHEISQSGNFYATYNNNIEFGTQKFFLSRIKHNFKMLVELESGEKKFINISGEAIDCVIRYQDDFKLKSLMDHSFYQKWNYVHKNSEYDFNFHSYSVKGHIYDIMIMLFRESPQRKPFNNPKYAKRVIRLAFFYLSLLCSKINNDKFNNNEDRIKVVDLLLSLFSTAYNLDIEGMENIINNDNNKNMLEQIPEVMYLVSNIVSLLKRTDQRYMIDQNNPEELDKYQSFIGTLRDEFNFIKEILIENNKLFDKDNEVSSVGFGVFTG